MLTTVALAMLSLVGARPAEAKLTVLTSTTDLRAIVEAVGGPDVAVDSIAKGTQDPHFIEAKPSYMLKASHADLLVTVGLELEIGWIPSITRGARNPRINPGNPGYLEVGPLVQPLEVPTGNVTRADGDVHPLGNPHVTLDPIRAGEIAVKIAERMGELDHGAAPRFASRAKAFQDALAAKTKTWSARVAKSGVKKVVTYHKTLTYFLDRFKLGNPAILEPKPGIPPTSGHILEVISTIKEQKIPLVPACRNLFDPTVTTRIQESVPGLRSATVPVAVDGAEGVTTLEALYERLVSTLEGK